MNAISFGSGWARNPHGVCANSNRRLPLVTQRDDLSVELCALYNQTGQHAQALALVNSRSFQPWEGGEGGPLGAYVRSHLALGRHAMTDGDAASARTF